MSLPAIAILMPGDMGHGVGAALVAAGHTVLTCLAGRGNATRALAARAGMQDTESLADLVKRADTILSILPPAAAINLATDIAAAMKDTGATPVYVDCNAISPGTARQVGSIVSAAGASFIDAGIIGLAPGKGGGTRFYVSGPDVTAMQELDGKEERVVRLRFGLSEGRIHTIAEVSEKLQVTPKRVRKLQSAAFHKLRDSQFRAELEAMLDVLD